MKGCLRKIVPNKRGDGLLEVTVPNKNCEVLIEVNSSKQKRLRVVRLTF